jgi:hypothetical protein
MQLANQMATASGVEVIVPKYLIDTSRTLEDLGILEADSAIYKNMPDLLETIAEAARIEMGTKVALQTSAQVCSAIQAMQELQTSLHAYLWNAHSTIQARLSTLA